jgi:hypothetical protein
LEVDPSDTAVVEGNLVCVAALATPGPTSTHPSCSEDPDLLRLCVPSLIRDGVFHDTGGEFKDEGTRWPRRRVSHEAQGSGIRNHVRFSFFAPARLCMLTLFSRMIPTQADGSSVLYPRRCLALGLKKMSFSGCVQGFERLRI